MESGEQKFSTQQATGKSKTAILGMLAGSRELFEDGLNTGDIIYNNENGLYYMKEATSGRTMFETQRRKLGASSAIEDEEHMKMLIAEMSSNGES